MLATLLPLALFFWQPQPPPMTGKDVGQIVTVLVMSPTHPRISPRRAVGTRSLLLDIRGSTAAFERLTGRELPVDSASWLPGVRFEPRDSTEALVCETLATPDVRQRCTVRDDAVWISLGDVRAGPQPGQIIVWMSVLWTRQTRDGARFMTGYTRNVILEKQAGGWKIVRELPTAVG